MPVSSESGCWSLTSVHIGRVQREESQSSVQTSKRWRFSASSSVCVRSYFLPRWVNNSFIVFITQFSKIIMMLDVSAFSVRMRRFQLWVLEVLVLLNLDSRLINVPRRKTGQFAQMTNGYKVPYEATLALTPTNPHYTIQSEDLKIEYVLFNWTIFLKYKQNII